MSAKPPTVDDFAEALMGGAIIKKIVVAKPTVRPELCKGCPFAPGIDAWMEVKLAVLKRELLLHPEAVWMCHETSGGGHYPTEKSLICRGAADWRREGER